MADGGCPFGFGGGGGSVNPTMGAKPVDPKASPVSNPSHPDEKLREHQTGIYYAEYLQLNKILGAQQLESERKGRPSHDEHLFIVIHQSYELWFKQILWELDSIRGIFMQSYIGEKELGTAIARMERIVEIQKVLVQQVTVLETLRPQDFLDFRELLYPASGFQSYQFRLFENKLGLFAERTYENKPVYYYLREEHQTDIRKSAAEPSLVELVQRWLERIPFLDQGKYHFWQAYKEAADAMLGRDKAAIMANPLLNEEQRNIELRNHEGNEASFRTIWDAEEHAKLVAQGRRRLSHKATLAALLIFLYRDEPLLQAPYRFLSLAQDIDEGVSLWRFRHMQMTQRMIGTKIGTGGSSGYAYLQKTVRMESYKVFVDLFNLSTFLLPRSVLPPLPESIKQQLQFVLTEEKAKEGHAHTHTHAHAHAHTHTHAHAAEEKKPEAAKP